MALDLSPFRRAVAQLAGGLAAAQAAPDDDLMRDGTIHRFEYTYELSHKFLRRFLAETEPAPDAVHELTFPSLIRLGAERGLLVDDWDVWAKHRKARGITSHTYDGAKAAEVFARIPAFLEGARALLTALGRRLAPWARSDVEPRWLSVVLGILDEHAPCPRRAWTFGSRVTGRARRFSDLDLALDAGRRLTLREEAILAACSPEFRREVEGYAVAIYAAH